ncbi:fdxN element excision recombinase XisF [Leptolyngbya sp. FACHB-17]|uniref:fdxN element excision recombinase XisF n=1 Tax=unclassified Leptolyngbya TaxID=2650499 RepID=UPI0016807F52|nr:fdxN element excision recombinase XisF [Leptolyngbya sp. FACHB-17]MBD2082688.1 recombinase family protein [Leptolyngbya sp. FACHB-17]
MAQIIAGLARVSTEDQAYQVALSNQVQRLRDSGCDRIYGDVASRADDGREGILRLIADIEAGEIAEVRITRLDRLTASPGLFERLVKIMRDRCIPLTGLDEHIDILDEDSEFFAGLGIYIAKRELQTIRKRARKGHESRRKNDRANTCMPWGYTAVNRHYRLNNTPFLCLLSDRPSNGNDHPGMTFADLARDCISLFWDGQGLRGAIVLIHKKYGIQRFSHPKPSKERGLAKSFVLDADDDFTLAKSHRFSNRDVFQWSHKGLRDWLLNPVLRGHTAYATREYLGLDGAGRKKYGKRLPQDQWDIRRDTHPDQALLTEAQVEEIRRILKHNGATRGKWLVSKKDRRYPISGLLRCQVCDAPMKSNATRVRQGQHFNYYTCKGKTQGRCDQNKSIRNDRAEAAIIEALTRAAERIDALRQTSEPTLEPPKLGQLREQLEGLRALGANPALDRARSDLESQVKRLEFNFKQEAIAKAEKQESAVEILRNPDFWQFCSEDERIRLFRWLVDTVWVQDGEIVRIALKI